MRSAGRLGCSGRRARRSLSIALALTFVVGPARLDASASTGCPCPLPASDAAASRQALPSFSGKAPVLRLEAERWIHKRLQRGNANEYTFVGNNPVTLTDPSGQAWFIPIIVAGLKWAGIAGGTVLASDLIAQGVTGHSDQGVNWTGDQYSPGALQLSGRAAGYGFVAGATFGAATAGLGALGASPLAAQMLAGPLSVGAVDLARGEMSHPGWYAAGFLAPAAIRGIVAGSRAYGPAWLNQNIQIRLATGAGQAWAGEAPMNARVSQLQAQLLRGERVALDRAARWTLRELGNASSGLGREIVVTRMGRTRYASLLDETGGSYSLQQGERLLLHTHPGQSFWGLQGSAFNTDVQVLGTQIQPFNGQRVAAVANEAGAWRWYSGSGELAPTIRGGR